MKSAFELAMERLDKTGGPTRKLSAADKTRIAEINKVYDAKAAGTKLAYETKLANAETVEELDRLHAELAEALASFETQREKEKDLVWNRA